MITQGGQKINISCGFVNDKQVLPHEDGKNTRYKLVTGPPVDRRCEFCSQPHHVGGPVWIAPIHDADFVAGMLDALEEDEDGETDGEHRDRFGTHDRMKVRKRYSNSILINYGLTGRFF